jgi:hypothetical protein
VELQEQPSQTPSPVSADTHSQAAILSFVLVFFSASRDRLLMFGGESSELGWPKIPARHAEEHNRQKEEVVAWQQAVNSSDKDIFEA